MPTAKPAAREVEIAPRWNCIAKQPENGVEFPQTQHGKDRNKCEQVQDIARSSPVRDADFVLGKTPKAAQLDERRLNVGK